MAYFHGLAAANLETTARRGETHCAVRVPSAGRRVRPCRLARPASRRRIWTRSSRCWAACCCRRTRSRMWRDFVAVNLEAGKYLERNCSRTAFPEPTSPTTVTNCSLPLRHLPVLKFWRACHEQNFASEALPPSASVRLHRLSHAVDARWGAAGLGAGRVDSLVLALAGIRLRFVVEGIYTIWHTSSGSGERARR